MPDDYTPETWQTGDEFSAEQATEMSQQIDEEEGINAQQAADISALQTRVTDLENAGGVGPHTHDWADVENEPATYPPDPHSHAISEVTDLQTGLDGKAPVVHNHTVASITDLAEFIRDTVAAFVAEGANITVTHDDAGNTLTIEGLGGGTTDPEVVRDTIGAALATVGPVSWTINDAADTITLVCTATVNATDAALRDRTTHTGEQPISSVTGLQSTLDGKAASSHTHSISNVTGLQSALDGKAASSHSHSIANVTGLQTALDSKVGSDGTILNTVKITQAAYDALGPGRPATTHYVIVG